MAHEPPTLVGLPDSDTLLAAIRDIRRPTPRPGNGPAMAKFIALVMAQVSCPRTTWTGPRPDPAVRQSTEDDGSRDNPLMRNMPACNQYQVDAAVLDALGDRLDIAVGMESGGGPAARGGRAVAAALGRRSRTSRATTAASSTAPTASRPEPTQSLLRWQDCC